MSNSPTIRPATTSDVAEMTEILNEIIAIGGTTANLIPQTQEQITTMCLTRDTLYCCHVATDTEGKIAGFQYLNRAEYVPDGVGDIATFARQSNKVRGVGTALIEATKAVARAAGLTQINARIRADNRPGLAYYSKMGFVDHDVDKDVPLSDGTPVDRISKRLQLT